jgi:hypothetical protein
MPSCRAPGPRLGRVDRRSDSRGAGVSRAGARRAGVTVSAARARTPRQSSELGGHMDVRRGGLAVRSRRLRGAELARSWMSGASPRSFLADCGDEERSPRFEQSAWRDQVISWSQISGLSRSTTSASGRLPRFRPRCRLSHKYSSPRALGSCGPPTSWATPRHPAMQCPRVSAAHPRAAAECRSSHLHHATLAPEPPSLDASCTIVMHSPARPRPTAPNDVLCR